MQFFNTIDLIKIQIKKKYINLVKFEVNQNETSKKKKSKSNK